MEKGFVIPYLPVIVYRTNKQTPRRDLKRDPQSTETKSTPITYFSFRR